MSLHSSPQSIHLFFTNHCLDSLHLLFLVSLEMLKKKKGFLIVFLLLADYTWLEASDSNVRENEIYIYIYIMKKNTDPTLGK